MRTPESDNETTTYHMAKGEYFLAAWSAAVGLLGGPFLLLTSWGWRMLSEALPNGLLRDALAPGPAEDMAQFLYVCAFGLGLCLFFALGFFLRARNVKVIVSDAGIVIQNWRAARRTIAWDNIVGVILNRYVSGRGPGLPIPICRLSVEVLSAGGKPRRAGVAYSYSRGADEIGSLAREIISRRGLSEVHHDHQKQIWR